MKSEINNAASRAIRTMRYHISKRNMSIQQRKLVDAIYEILAKNESEILRRIEEKKNYETKLKKWLENPVETERTNALEEHDLVV